MAWRRGSPALSLPAWSSHRQHTRRENKQERWQADEEASGRDGSSDKGSLQYKEPGSGGQGLG